MTSKLSVLQRIHEVGVVPVIRARSGDEATRIVDAVRAGGVPVIEITMTVPGALKVMEETAAKFDDVVLGAGTVLDAETARLAILAGAEFVVSPQLNLGVVETALRYGKVVAPGALTPTEVVTAWQAGADMVKVFPAGAVGGPSYIKALKAPLPQVDLIPTGGVNLKTAADFITAGACALGVGSALVDKKAITDGRFDVLTENARKFVEIVQQARAAQ